jgi:hypothetical protein
MAFESMRTGKQSAGQPADAPTSDQDATQNQVDPIANFWSAPDDALFTIPDIAKVLNCSQAKLERDRWRGEGIGALFFKIDGMVRVRKGDVTARMRNPKETIAA